MADVTESKVEVHVDVVDEPAASAAEEPAAPTAPAKAKSHKKGAPKLPAKKTVKAAPKKSPAARRATHTHPKYNVMVRESLTALNERGGASRQAILKYVMANYILPYDDKAISQHLGMTLRAGVQNGSLKQSKGSGACGSFKLGEAKPLKSHKANPAIKKVKASPKKVTKKTTKSKAKKTKAKASPKKTKVKVMAKKAGKKPAKPKSIKKKAKAAA